MNDGCTPFGYTAIGEQVGMAQRMVSVAPPGGVMLSESTARLVDGSGAGRAGVVARQRCRGTAATNSPRGVSIATAIGSSLLSPAPASNVVNSTQSLDQYRARPSAVAGSSTDRSVPRVWASTVARTSGTGLAVRAANWPPCRGLVRCFGCRA
jgi:adenylate cyclase